MTGSLEVAALPDRLTERDQWVCWRTKDRDGKATKVPIDPASGGFASATDPETWADVETALACLESGSARGLGFVFTEADPLVGVDLDDCRDPETGEVETDAQDVIRRLDSYTEISPSGTGFHVLLEGEFPDGRNRRGSIECYDQARYFTVTADVVADRPTRIGYRQDALAAIHREYLAEDSTDSSDVAAGCSDSDATAETGNRSSAASLANGLDDAELLERARSAANSAKFERLWNGRTTDYDSHSEADMALCCLLAFWSGGDRMQMDRLFRRSGLLRDKWDEVHYADGSTYGEKTIERAVATTSEFYDPSEAPSARDSAGVADDSMDGGETGAADVGRSQLTEEHGLLVDRVQYLEATLEQKQERIAELEASGVGDANNEPVVQSSSTDSPSTDEDRFASSILSRTRRLFGGSE